MNEAEFTHPFRQRLTRTQRLVVKFGSGMLVASDHRLDEHRMESLVRSLVNLLDRGIKIVIVTSGAVAAGAPILGLARKAKTIPQKQACAAIGQSLLMAVYERLFSERGHHTAQILLTQDDVRHRQRYLNAKNTLETLLSEGIVPIVNENDTVVVEEIKFGDNDQLSAQVAALVGADLLLLLSTVAGLFEKNPGQGESLEKPIPFVERIRTSHFNYAQDQLKPTSISSGGMKSKLMAIEKAGQYGIPAVLASGLEEGIIDRVVSGYEEGTLFLPSEDRLSARKYWIMHTLAPRGTLTVDSGAVRVLREQGKSLLPIGITGVEGNFRSGDCVRIVGPDGLEFAHGLTYYNSQEVASIRGRRSEEIESKLGYRYYDEVIHRDNLVLIR
jgi:glutamate 5-kinase